MSNNSDEKKKTKHFAIMDLDALAPTVQKRNSVSDTRRRVRQAQAEAQHRRAVAEEESCLLAPSNFTSLIDFDQSDPLLQQLTDADNAGGAIILGAADREKDASSSSDDDSDDDVVRSVNNVRKRKRLIGNKSKPVALPVAAPVADDDSSDDDFKLSMLKPKKVTVVVAEKNDSSDDDLVPLITKKKNNTVAKKAPARKQRAVKASSAPTTARKSTIKAAPPAAVQEDSSDSNLFSSSDEEDNMPPADALTTPNLSNEDPEEDSDDPMPGLSLEESHCLRLLDCRVVAAEEQLALGLLDDNILMAEEAATMCALGSRIRETADLMATSGGMVTVTAANPTKTIPKDVLKLEQEWDLYAQKELLFGGVNSMCNIAAELIKEKGNGILELDNMGNGELRATKELPKYLGNTQDLLFTKEELDRMVVSKLYRNDYIKANEFSVTVADKEGDPFTIVVEMCGQKEVIEKAKTYLQLLIRARIFRFVPLDTKLNSSKNSSASKKMHEIRPLIHYQRFEKKVHRIKEIEFGDIHARSVWSSMWKMHKNRLGNVCNRACRCITELDILTSTVIPDQEKKKSKNGEKFEPRAVVGFCSRFAPKFMPLLRKKFPRETNEEIFQRLLHMWDQHKKQQRFGTICREDCSCAEGWSSVFKKGVFDKKKTAPLNTNSDAGPKDSKLPAQIEIPSKQSRIIETEARPQHRPFLSGSPRQIEYEIVFDTRHQLGFFCVTKKREKWDVCKILSVNSIGAKTDARLHSETIITAVDTGNSEQWIEIRSHEDLKEHYENRKKYGGNIRIRFINVDVKTGKSGDRDDKLWTSSNTLSSKSKFFQGWAGGAPPLNDANETRGIFSSSAASGSKMTTAKAATAEFKKTDTATTIQGVPKEAIDDDTSRRVVHVQARVIEGPEPAPEKSAEPRKCQPRHRGSSKPLSIFNKKSSKPQASNQHVSLFRNLSNSLKKPNASVVNWVQSYDFETRYYTEYMTPEGKDKAVQKDTSTDTTTKGIQRSSDRKSDASELQKKLRSVISHKSCVDVFDVLNAGAETKPAEVAAKDMPEVYAKRMRDSLKNEQERNPTSASRKSFADAKMKVVLIKIFDRARDIMDNCRCLKKWARYEFKIDRVQNLVLKAAANPADEDRFQCAVAIRGEMLGSTSWVKLAKTMDWSEAEAKRFAFNHNASLPARSSERNNNLLVNFRKVGGPSALHVDLASETRALTDIGKASTGSRYDATFNMDVAVTKHLQSARAIISVRKLGRETKKKIDEQRRSYQRELKTLIDEIAQFNADKSREIAGMHKLDFNIQHNITPLHAAIYLNDVELVNKILQHGADVNAKDRSTSMTPKMLAMSEIIAAKRAPNESQNHEIEKLRKIRKLLGCNDNFDDDEIHLLPADEQDEYLFEDTIVVPNVNNEASILPNTTRLAPHAMTQNHGNTSLAPWNASESNDAGGGARASLNGPNTSASRVNETHSLVSEAILKKEYAVGDIPAGHHKRHSAVYEESSSRKRSRTPEKISPQVTKIARRDLCRKEDLPRTTLERLTGGAWICNHYHRKKGCRWGRDCRHAHLENIDPTNVDLGSNRPSYARSRDLNIQKDVDRSGRMLYTAMYRNNEENIYLKACGGATVGENRDGLHWYTTEDYAVEAIEQVITLWQNAVLKPQSSQNRRNSALNVDPPPSQGRESRLALSKFEPPLCRDSDTAVPSSRRGSSGSVPLNPPFQAVKPSDMSDEEGQVFDELISTNLNNTIIKILKEPLKSTDWSVRKLRNESTLWMHGSFTKCIASNFPKETFCSMGNGPDCRYIDGKWYYKDIRRAKASAMLEFLKVCKKIGILWSLTQMSTTLEELPFWKNRKLS